MLRYIAILLTFCLGFAAIVSADPLEEKDIKAFNVNNLSSSSFDVRMKAFRIIQNQGWNRRYRRQALAAIKRMLASKNIMQRRTGIQGLNLMRYQDPELLGLISGIVTELDYAKGSQNFYFRQSLIPYLLRELKNAKGEARACKRLAAAAAIAMPAPAR